MTKMGAFNHPEIDRNSEHEKHFCCEINKIEANNV